MPRVEISLKRIVFVFETHQVRYIVVNNILSDRVVEKISATPGNFQISPHFFPDRFAI